MSACQKVAHLCSYNSNSEVAMDYRSLENRFSVNRINSSAPRSPSLNFALRRSPSSSGSGIIADNHGVTLTYISSAPASSLRYSTYSNYSGLTGFRNNDDTSSYRLARSGKPPLPAFPSKRPPSPAASSSTFASGRASSRRLSSVERRPLGELSSFGSPAVSSLTRRFENSLNTSDSVSSESSRPSVMGLKSALASSHFRDHSSDRRHINDSINGTHDRMLTPKLYRDKKVAFSLPDVPDHVKNMTFREFEANNVLSEKNELDQIDLSPSSAILNGTASEVIKIAPKISKAPCAVLSAALESRPYHKPNTPEIIRRNSVYQTERITDDFSTKSKINENKIGLIGLRNLGNTCFMNSVLQCLSHSVALREYCLGIKFVADINSTSRLKGALIKAFNELLAELWEPKTILSSSYINPERFKLQIQKFAPRFTGYNQQDAQEFLRYLLQGLHEDVNRVKNDKSTSLSTNCLNNNNTCKMEFNAANEFWSRYLTLDNSRIVDIFVGQLKSELQCSHCGHVSTTYDPFWDLSLTIPQQSSSSGLANIGFSSRYASSSGRTVSLMDCMDAFTREEILDGDEKPTCESCKSRRKCSKKFSIQKLPQILVLHLKRFTGERYKSRLSTLVQFPLTKFDLSSYVCQSAGANFPHKYDLYAVSNHTGTPMMGHYTAYCRRTPEKDWFLFDDSRVTPVNESNVVSSEAYVLFYAINQSISNNVNFNNNHFDDVSANGLGEEGAPVTSANVGSNFPPRFTFSSRF